MYIVLNHVVYRTYMPGRQTLKFPHFFDKTCFCPFPQSLFIKTSVNVASLVSQTNSSNLQRTIKEKGNNSITNKQFHLSKHRFYLRSHTPTFQRFTLNGVQDQKDNVNTNIHRRKVLPTKKFIFCD